jgi:hypothetical protein
LIPLQDVSKDKSEWVSKSAFLSESGIWERDSNLGNGNLFFIDSRKDSDPSNEPDVKPGISILGTAGVVDNCQRVFVERAVQILHY